MGRKKSVKKLVAQEIDKLGLSESELKHVLKQLKKPQVLRDEYKLFEDLGELRLGVISDTHYGSKFFDLDTHLDSVAMFEKYEVDAIYHTGDVLEGMSNREGHIYELDKIGLSAQMDFAVEMLNEYKQPLYFITGNHDQWAMRKSNQGFRVGETLEDRLDNAKFLGEMYADVNVGGDEGIKIRLSHEGRTAYALSYSLQKRINALSGGQKPDVIFNGHLHKSLYMFYRNIHAFEAGCLQKQTPFMMMKGSPAHLGFWIVDLAWNKKGIKNISPKFFPHYE